MSNLSLLLEQLNEINNNENNDENNNEICLISGEKITKNEEIKLPCNHIFNYSCLLEELKIQKKYNYHIFICPYCRKSLNGYLPLHSNHNYIRGITSKKNTFIDIKNCSYKYTKGKNKGLCCSKNKKYYNLDYCSFNNKKKDYNKCSFILIKGKNKGKECSKKCLDNSNFCKNHNK